jgi:HK97 family phage portal protein
MKFPSIRNFFNRAKPEQISLTRSNFGYSAGTIVSEESAMEVSAFYRGVIYVSTQIAKLPWHVKDEKNLLLDNDISYILNVSPNEEMTSFNFKIFLIQCAIITGNGYAEIERTMDGRIKKLWPLNPKRVSPIRDVNGTLYYQVLPSTYGGETVYLAPRDIFVVRNLHTKDAIQGLGLVGYAMQTLGISLGADKMANSLFANGGMPSGVLTHPGRISEEAAKRIAASWKENHGGKKTGGTALLEEGVTYNPISHSPDVLQFLESRQFNVIEIARFLGIPPTKLFDSNSAKFNNIEHSNLEVATDTLDSWARNLESEADMKLLVNKRSGKKTELDLYAVFRGDMSTRATYFQKMMQAGAITPNEIRLKEGLAPYDGGDRYYIATNNFSPADRVDEIVDAQVAPKETSKPSPAEEAVDEAVASYITKTLKR